MVLDSEMLQNISVICKYLYKHPNTHRNTMRKDLLTTKKIASKEKFNQTLESLIALGKISLTKENVSLSPEIMKTGVLQQDKNGFFIVTPDSKKHIRCSNKNIFSGFSVGDIIDFTIDYNGPQSNVIILGRNKTELSNTESNLSKKSEYESQTKPTEIPQSDNLILGRVVKLDRDELVFIPNDKSIVPRHVPILNNKEEIPSFENKLCKMDLTSISAPRLGGTIVQVRGDAGNPIHEYEAIAEMVGAKLHWDEETLRREIAKIPKTVDTSSLSLISEEDAETNHRGNIVDMRNIPFCTTDPAGARDKDDAIYSTYDEDGNLVVYTAIANVPKYLDLDSELGKIYANLIFTFYTPTRAYGVCPPELSTGICSFVTNEDRHAFVVKTVIDKETGKVKSSSFYDALINCKQQYTYEEAQEIVDSFGDEDFKTHFEYKFLTNEPLTPEEQVLMNFYAAQELKLGFEKRKMLRFSGKKEYSAKFDSDQTTILDIEHVKHLLYHEVIEFFMITANEASAEFAKENDMDTIFRIHDAPNSKKIDRASEFFEILGINFDGNLSAEGIRTLVELVKNSPSEELVNQFLIKMQSRAIYSDHPFNNSQTNEDTNWFSELYEPISHFALQSKGYSHTTAPIRRAVDYVVIYNILAKIHGTKPLSKDIITKIIENANEMQLRIDEGEKAIKSINGVFYAENHIGEQLRGRVSKIRYTSPEEGYSDEIVAVVTNDEKGIIAEIPISQILGRKDSHCYLSPRGCSVCDSHGNIVLKLCQPLDFVIEKADRKTMNIVGRTSKELVYETEQNSNFSYKQSHLSQKGRNSKKVKKYQGNKKSNNNHNQKKHKNNSSQSSNENEKFQD